MVGGCRTGTPATSTTKTGHHDIEILLNVALNNKKSINQSSLGWIRTHHNIGNRYTAAQICLAQ
jgi:hypothetical protein